MFANCSISQMISVGVDGSLEVELSQPGRKENRRKADETLKELTDFD